MVALAACLFAGPALLGVPETQPATPGSLGLARTRYTVRLEELELARHRLVMEFPGVKLMYLEELVGLESVERRLGVALPFAVAGPLAPSGLWRKVLSPLAHGPESTAHTEATGLRLDTSFDASSRRGAALVIGSPALRALRGGLAVVETAHTPFQGAGWLECRAPGGGSFQALAVYSLPPADRQPEAWLLPEVPYPGGGLLHLAGGMQVGSDTAALSWSGALSGGPLVRSGIFSEALLLVEGRVCELSLLGGVSSPDYRTPHGSPGERALRGAARVELDGGSRDGGSRDGRSRDGRSRDGKSRDDHGAGFGKRTLPAVFWTLESELEAVCHRPAAGLAAEDGAPLIEHRISTAAILETRLTGGISLQIEATGEAEHRALTGGRAEHRGSASVAVRTETDRAQLEGELAWRGDTGGEDALLLRLYGERRRPQGFQSLCLRAALSSPEGSKRMPPGALLACGLRGELARGGWCLFVDLHTRKELWLSPGVPGVETRAGPLPTQLLDLLALTLGWDVRVRPPR